MDKHSLRPHTGADPDQPEPAVLAAAWPRGAHESVPSAHGTGLPAHLMAIRSGCLAAIRPGVGMERRISLRALRAAAIAAVLGFSGAARAQDDMAPADEQVLRLVTALLIYLFAIRLDWLPAIGRQGPESILLPALTLGSGIAATTSRLLRASLLDTLSQPYILMAEAKGLPRGRLLFRHALRPAMVPVLTSSSLVAGGLLGGAVVVETVFAWPGVGRYMIEAIGGRDYPVIQGFTLFMAVLFVGLNYVVDILYRFLDPRVRVDAVRV